MKPGRQSIILDIISSKSIETQFDLMQALLERGVKSTQATLSRDIRDLHLVKEPGPDGRSRYTVSKESELQATDTKLRKIFKESVISMDTAQNILVLKTLPGLANAACSAIDGMSVEGLVGTLAGDDTAFIAMKDCEQAEKFYEMVKSDFI